MKPETGRRGSGKLVILDRDGVINQDSDDYIKSEEEWIPVEGSPEAIAELSRAGYTIAVATNQSGLARGLFDEYALACMHRKMRQLVAEAGGVIDGIFYCPHGPDEGCQCRKPAVGLLRQIESELQIPVKGAACVGDSYRDIEAARAAGCEPWLVLTGKGRRTLEQCSGEQLRGVTVVEDLATAARRILQRQAPAAAPREEKKEKGE